MKTKVLFISILMAVSPAVFSEETSKSSDKITEAFKGREVKGLVIKHKTVGVFSSAKQRQEALKSDKPARAPVQNMIALLKTEKGSERLVVDLGQADKLPEIKDNKTKLVVEGRLVKLGDRRLFVARKVEIDGKRINPEHQKFSE